MPGVAVVAKLVDAADLGSVWVAAHCGFESRRPHDGPNPTGEYMGKAKKPASRKPAKKPGPEAERLVIDGDWEEAVRQSLRKPKLRTPKDRKAQS